MSDVSPAQRLGAHSILVLTGHGSAAQAAMRAGGFQPEHVVGDLAAAVQLITAREGRHGAPEHGALAI